MSEVNQGAADRARLQRMLQALQKMQARLDAVERARTEPIAIVGMGCRFPGDASTPPAFWELLQNGVDAVRKVPAERWDPDLFYDDDPDAPGKTYVRHGAFLNEVDTFDPGFFDIAAREATHMDPQQRLLLEVSWEALENAGIAPNSLVNSKTGVYMGLMNNDYMRFEVGEIDATNFDYYGDTGDVGLLAGRLSYVLGLQGPSVVVTTACSSSLVATHLACQALRAGDCELALAGGVNLILAPDANIVFAKLRAMAHDGRCKTFDAAADGYGRGEGCGVIVLKRLSAAQANGDPILGLIRGTAVNHNGPSGGLTVPNGVAQANLIRSALEMGALDPDSISYVETHGTGTRLGDPIEVRALGRVFGRKRPPDNPLWIGSVKTNIGHLEAAAGVAGLIKTILALQHRQIPPHLHFEDPNPEIPWHELPLTVPTQLQPWPANGAPRRAGVSAFGMSGINAHIVLEEAPHSERTGDDDASGERRPFHLLTLSAKSEAALDQATANLAAYLEVHREADIAEVAHTLQVGRSQFTHRRAVVCRDTADALAALGDPGRLLEHTLEQEQERPVTFMFPGLGDQYVHVAAQLYRHEAVFRRCVDRCSELLQPILNLDLRELLYPEGEGGVPAGAAGPDLRQMLNRPAGNGVTANGHSAKSSPLAQTTVAQPLVFVLEYALAQLWRSWGIRPQALIGYSLGEYVAACLAGVFSLEDGLRLVARRAQLIESLPPGAMLAVALAEEDVTTYLDGDLCLSGVNGPLMCVVAGPPGAVAALQNRLQDDDIACRPVQTTHAFHSTMMAPIVAPFRELLQTIEFRPPQLPYISNVTGAWARAEEVTDPQYWISHLQRPVRFADGVQTLWQKGDNVLLEVGVGQTLGSLALQHPARVARPTVLSSLPTVHDRRPDLETMLRTLGQLWLAGVSVEWAAASGGRESASPRRYLALPTYPFERRRYWVKGARPTPPGSNGQPAARVGATPLKMPDKADWFYTPTWQRMPLTQAIVRFDRPRTWLCFLDEQYVGEALVERLRSEGQEVVVVKQGDALQRLADDIYVINPAAAEDYAALIKHLYLINKGPDHIVHLWNVTAETEASPTVEAAQQAQKTGFFSLLFLAQALGSQALDESVHVHVVSNNMQDVLGGEGSAPHKAPLLGPVKTMPQEYEQIECASIDIMLSTPAATLAEQILAEIMAGAGNNVVAYRGSTRWLPSFAPMRLEDDEQGATRLKQRGVYLITGGFGGLGAALAEGLARRVQARLVLLGRTPLPARAGWPALLANEATPAGVRRRLQQIEALEALGAEVLSLSADVADRAQMQQALAKVHDRFGTVDGLFHVAGVPGEGLMQLKQVEDAVRVLRPKVHGALVLNELLQDEPLEFMVFYSSIVVAMSGLGEVDYCAANTFLDALAHYNRRRGIPTVSINWGMWQWDDWQSSLVETMSDVYGKLAEARQKYGFSFDEGLEALWRVLGTSLPQVMVSSLPLETAANLWHSLTYDGAMQRVQGAEDRQIHPRPQLHTPYVAPGDPLEEQIAEVWAQCLGLDKVGIHDRFQELGGNSLLGIALISRLKEELDVQLSASTLYEGPTVRAMYEVVRAGKESAPAPTLSAEKARGKQRKRLRRRRQRVRSE